jgi:DNA-directed RNA polymerase subunit RPC12/RpoP
MSTKCQCSQCGSTDFKKEGEEFLRCAYCNSLFKMQPQETANSNPKVVIKGGANVVFGKNSDVTIKGGLLIEKGANVEFLGKLDIVEKASEEKIKEAKELLKLQKEE